MRQTFKQILVSEQVYQKLRNQGKAGDSINDVISRLLPKDVVGETQNLEVTTA